MMMKNSCGLHKVAGCLLVIGGLNWLLVGIFGEDLFGMLGMGMGDLLPRIVYILVGASAFAELCRAKCCGKCADCKPSAGAAMPPKA